MNLFVFCKPEEPAMLKQFSAVINVSDNPCLLFESPVPYFWFPIIECAEWGYIPFLGARRVLERYSGKEDKVLIHCEGGAVRSPAVAWALFQSRLPDVLDITVDYYGHVFGARGVAIMQDTFERYVARKYIPEDIVQVLSARNQNKYESIVSDLHHQDKLSKILLEV